MPTSFNEIEDLALILIQDYRIDNLAQTDYATFQTFMDGLLVRAIPRFTKCVQDLSYNLATREFNATYTNLEQEILAEYVAICWMAEITQNITQMNAKLSNKEFKSYSEAENLKQKSEYLDHMRENVKQLTSDYEINNLQAHILAQGGTLYG